MAGGSAGSTTLFVWVVVVVVVVVNTGLSYNWPYYIAPIRPPPHTVGCVHPIRRTILQLALLYSTYQAPTTQSGLCTLGVNGKADPYTLFIIIIYTVYTANRWFCVIAQKNSGQHCEASAPNSKYALHICAHRKATSFPTARSGTSFDPPSNLTSPPRQLNHFFRLLPTCSEATNPENPSLWLGRSVETVTYRSHPNIERILNALGTSCFFLGEEKWAN